MKKVIAATYFYFYFSFTYFFGKAYWCFADFGTLSAGV